MIGALRQSSVGHGLEAAVRELTPSTPLPFRAAPSNGKRRVYGEERRFTASTTATDALEDIIEAATETAPCGFLV
jgi:hypothetical protein